MSALVIDSRVARDAMAREGAAGVVPDRRVVTPDRRRERAVRRPAAARPAFGVTPPLGGVTAHACGVPMRRVSLASTWPVPEVAQEWQLTRRGMAVGIALMATVFILGVWTLVQAYLAIPV